MTHPAPTDRPAAPNAVPNAAPAAPAAPGARGDSARGLAFALASYTIWGGMPLYLKMVAHIPLAEVVAHRVLWSLPVAGAVIVILRRTDDLRRVLRTPSMLRMGLMTAALVSMNWGIYVHAIMSGQTLDAALGYYINPLFSVLLGALLLGERPLPLQWVAIALAAAAVAILTWQAGRVPLVALGLTLTWGIYAYLKRSLPIGPNQGFFLEVLFLSPVALAWALWVTMTGSGHFLAGSVTDTLLLMGCGVVTAVPLICYANGAKLLRLSTIGILQYVSPTLVLVVALFVFGEPFGRAEAVAFPMIWAALALYTGAMLRQSRSGRR